MDKQNSLLTVVVEGHLRNTEILEIFDELEEHHNSFKGWYETLIILQKVSEDLSSLLKLDRAIFQTNSEKLALAVILIEDRSFDTMKIASLFQDLFESCSVHAEITCSLCEAQEVLDKLSA